MEREEAVTIVVTPETCDKIFAYLDRYLAVVNRALDIQEKMLGDIDGE